MELVSVPLVTEEQPLARGTGYQGGFTIEMGGSGRETSSPSVSRSQPCPDSTGPVAAEISQAQIHP